MLSDSSTPGGSRAGRCLGWPAPHSGSETANNDDVNHLDSTQQYWWSDKGFDFFLRILEKVPSIYLAFLVYFLFCISFFSSIYLQLDILCKKSMASLPLDHAT